MWGELAYQLYGLDGYEYLKDYDQDQDAPGEGLSRNSSLSTTSRLSS